MPDKDLKGLRAWSKHKSRWKRLQQEAVDALSEQGSKKELCLMLGIRQSALSKILHQDSQPSAEVALALKEWLDHRAQSALQVEGDQHESDQRRVY